MPNGGQRPLSNFFSQNADNLMDMFGTHRKVERLRSVLIRVRYRETKYATANDSTEIINPYMKTS